MAFSLALLGASTYEAPVAAGSYDLLETTTLTSSASSVSFIGLGAYATDYQHLQIRIVAKCSRTSLDVQNLLTRFNGIDNSYTGHQLRGVNGSVISGTFSGLTSYCYLYPMAGNITSGVFGAGVYDILDPFETTKNTTLRGFDGLTGGFKQVALRSAGWFNTSALSSISFTPDDSNDLLAGSRFSLYGIKAD
jgi:hypothetical protein